MRYPVVALIITNVIWGAAAPIFKYALTDIPPFILAFIRFFFAALIFFPAAVTHWQKLSVRTYATICLAAFFGITVNISFFFKGLQYGQSISAPVIVSGGPIFLFILAVLFLHEKPKKQIFAGMLVSLIGVLIVVMAPIIENMKSAGLALQANIFFVVATVGAVMDPFIAKRILGRVNAYQFTFVAFTFAAITFLPMALAESATWRMSQISMPGMIGIVYGVVFSSAIAYFCLYWGLARLRAQEVGIFTYIDPVAALIVAIPLLHEYPTPSFIVGSFFVFTGIYIAEKRIHWHPLHKLR